MHVEIVPVEAKFAETFYKWRGEAHTVRYNPLAPTTLEQIHDRFALACSDLSDLKRATEFSFFARVDGRLAASLSLKNLSHMMAYAEIGYTVGTAVVRAFVGKIFMETKLRRIFALVAEGNMPSRRILEKLGFCEEGILREHYVIQGQPINEVYYGLLRSDWEKAKPVTS
jgi:ribosomal-protein-alanine N-acetyltransferase